MRGISGEYLEQNTLPSLDDWDLDMVADYGGSDRKDGLIAPDGQRYLIKYAEEHTRVNDLDTSYVNNVISEYISSHVLQIIGFPTHDTFIATRGGNVLVACKNFVSGQERLIEFGRYMRKYYDSAEVGRTPDIGQIKYILSNDPVLKTQEARLWKTYCERFVGDALTGNFDRHMGNWGYLVDPAAKTVVPSPIYDNGSTLFPALGGEGMKEILQSHKEMTKRVLLFPKAALRVNGKKVSYFDMLASNYDAAMSQAVRDVVPRIQQKMPEIQSFIRSVMFISDVRKRFYSTILEMRLKQLLLPAYEHCRSGRYHEEAYERLQRAAEYDEALFEQKWREKNRV